MKLSQATRAKTDLDDQTFPTTRLEALTDAVFSIAMTLLVLDLTVAKLGPALTNSDLWRALYAQKESIVSFVVSFFLLGSMWGVHMRQFRFIKKTDRHLIMVNNIRLFLVVLMPFTTSISGSYSNLALGTILLPLNFLLLTVVSYYEWSYAENPVHGLADPLEPELKRQTDARNMSIIILAALTTVLSIWLGQLAFLVMLASGVLTKFLIRQRSTDQ